MRREEARVIIECPACHTRYRTDGSLAVTEATLFECSREQCGHVFPYLPESLKETVLEPLLEDPILQPTDTPQAASPVPSTVHEQRQSRTVEPPPIFEDAPDEPFFLTTPPPLPPAPNTPRVQSPAVTPRIETDFSEEEEFILGSASAPTPAPPAAVSSPSMENKLRTDPLKRSPQMRSRPRPVPSTTFSIWPALGLLVLLVVGYYLLGNRWKTNLADTENMLARLPVVGSSFVASQFSPQHIVLSDVKSGFWITKDSKRVFAISGKVTNNAPVPASMIQIEGQLHDIDGGTIEQRIISCGMGTTVESLPTLTTHEINVLQGLVPPKQFHVPPGQTINFLIVFPNPPTTVTELSCRVATAQFSTS